MARGFSKAILCGNVTRDPETRVTPSGAQVTSFSLAVNRVYRDSSGNNQENVSFFDIVAWGKLGETIAQYAKKGTGMLVSGRLEQRSWEDKNGGGKRSRVELVVEDFNFIGGGAGGNSGDYDGAGKSGGSSKGGKAAKSDAGAEEVVPEDIPEEEGDVKLDDIPF